MEIGHADCSSRPQLPGDSGPTRYDLPQSCNNLATALRKYGSKGKRRDRSRCYEDETQSVFEIITQPMQLFLELNFLGRAPWKRNQVFERVFCADVHSLPLLPLPPPSKRPAGFGKSASTRPLARGTHRARRHVHAHVGSPWSADEHVCLDMLCGIPFVFGVLLRAQSTPSSRCRRRCSRGL